MVDTQCHSIMDREKSFAETSSDDSSMYSVATTNTFTEQDVNNNTNSKQMRTTGINRRSVQYDNDIESPSHSSSGSNSSDDCSDLSDDFNTNCGKNENASLRVHNECNVDGSHSEMEAGFNNSISMNILSKIKTNKPKFRHDFNLREKLMILDKVKRCGNKKQIAREYKTTAKSIRNWMKNRHNILKRSLLNPKAKTAHIGNQPVYNALKIKVYEWYEKMLMDDIPIKSSHVIAEAFLNISSFHLCIK